MLSPFTRPGLKGEGATLHPGTRTPPTPALRPPPPLTPCSFDPVVPRLPDEEHLQGAALRVRRGCICVRDIPEDDSSAERGAPDDSLLLGLQLFVNAGESRQRTLECFPLLVRKILSAIFI